MKKKIFLNLLIFLSLFMITGCGGEKTKEINKPELLNIEKIYYEINEDSSVSMYLVYSIKSDEEKDITLGESANLVVDTKTQGSTFYTYDKNKNIIEQAGFPSLVSYKTLYSGSNETLKYIATFTINKKYISNKEKVKLQVPYNGEVTEKSPVTEYEYLEKNFSFDELNCFLYSDNNEFIQEFKKDYNLN